MEVYANTTLIIFDCDGVLIDSEILSFKVWAKLLTERNIHIDERYFSEHFLGRSFEHVQTAILRDFSFVVNGELADGFASELKCVFERELRPIEGIEALLSSLSVPYCLATSSSRPRTNMALKATGLDRFFNEKQIFTVSDVARGKPSPDLFLHAAKQYDVTPSQCLVFEDSAPGVEAAKAAKMCWRRFTGGSHINIFSGNNERELANWYDFKREFPSLLS